MEAEESPPEEQGFLCEDEAPPPPPPQTCQASSSSAATDDRSSSCCFNRYYKCLLWLSLSLYFFSSYLITNNNHPHSHIAPQATLGRLKGLKVFVYDLRPEHNADWLANERCGTHLFTSEVAIHRALLASEVRTLDPYESDFFFVPVYVSCNFSSVNDFPSISHARSLISSAGKLVSADHPFWNRSRGSDHVFVASHDFGAGFHTLEDAAMAHGIPEIMRNSIVLQTLGVDYKHPCQDVGFHAREPL